MDELSEKIISLNVSADDLDVSADEEFSFLSDSDSYDLYEDISLKNYNGLLVHEESSDFNPRLQERFTTNGLEN